MGVWLSVIKTVRKIGIAKKSIAQDYTYGFFYLLKSAHFSLEIVIT